MKYLLCTGLIILLLSTHALPQAYVPYDFNRKYTVAQLKSDFTYFRKILEQNHPRLFEYFPKKEFDHFTDSLFRSINSEMTEREFQYFLLPVVSRIRCSHTKLLPSRNLLNLMGNYFRAPPVRLFFAGGRAWLRNNYSADTSVEQGAEVFSVNDVLVADIINNFAERLPREGLNRTFIYNRMNAAIWPNNGFFGFFPGLPDYPVIDTYRLSFQNPGSATVAQVSLPAIAYNDYQALITDTSKKDYSFYIIDSLSTAVLTVSSFLHSDRNHAFENFIEQCFDLLSKNRTQNLVIDVRGNIGGIPECSVMLLTHIMKDKFVYFSHAEGYEEYKRAIPIAKNRFKGKIFFLADGGCRSTTGHFLAMARNYNLGPVVGEESCSSWSCNDNGAPYVLPNSKLVLNCPAFTFSIAVKNMSRGHGVIPDYPVAPPAGTIISGRDSVLQFALRLAATGNGN